MRTWRNADIGTAQRWRLARRLLAVTSLLVLTVIVSAGAAPVSWPVGGGNGKWKVEASPNPRTAQISILSSVSCPARASCFAVGSSSKTLSTPTLPLAERWAGGRWRIQAMPAPSRTSDSFYGVSCPSTHVCIAVGSAFHLAGRRQTILTEAWNGQRWRVLPTAPGSSPATLFAVSCTSASSCMAVGSSQNAHRPQTLVERWDGTSWSIQQVPGLTPTMKLLGISCSGAHACTAAGYDTTSGTAVPLAESWNGATWRMQTVPLPHGKNAGMFDAVSCTSARACTATGTDFNPPGPTLAERWDGKTWRVESTPSPANSSVSASEVALTGVSCTSAKSCTAIGSYAPGLAAAYFIESWNGTRWRLKTAPRPSDYMHGALLGVSCVSMRCTAVGGYTGTTRIQLTLAMAG